MKTLNLLEVQQEAKRRGIEEVTAFYGLLNGTIDQAR